MFEDEMKKILVFMRGFKPEERVKLARMTALWVGSGLVPPSVLAVLSNEHLIKDGVALDFLLELFVTLKNERGISSLITALKRGSLDSRLMEFMPLNKRTEENFIKIYKEHGLEDVVKLQKQLASQELKQELQNVSRIFANYDSDFLETSEHSALDRIFITVHLGEDFELVLHYRLAYDLLAET